MSVEDSVFDLGADSLLVFQITTRAQQAGLGITPRDVFQLRTVAALVKASRSSVATRGARPRSQGHPAPGDAPSGRRRQPVPAGRIDLGSR